MKIQLCTRLIFLFFQISLCADIVQDSEVSSYSGDREYKTCKYVMGGLQEPGDGSRFKPYNSLALAQADTSWTTLFVLSSPVPLDGGITLRPNTRLIGDKRLMRRSLTISEPIITNSSDATNGGNGVIVEPGGKVEIADIYFKDTWASAIRYDNAGLTVSYVLISGCNRGNVFDTISSLSEPYQVAAIHGQSNSNGFIFVQDTVIHDNNSGNAILDIAYGGAHRTMSILAGQIERLRNSNAAIGVLACDDKTRHILNVNYLYLGKFLPCDSSVTDNYGLKIQALNGAKQKINIDSCSFNNLSRYTKVKETAILLKSSNLNDSGRNKSRTCQKAVIERCRFIPYTQGGRSIGIQKETVNSIAKIEANFNELENVSEPFISILDGKQLIGDKNLKLFENKIK